jgi:two-component system, sporulation sensor kinase B
MDFITKGLLVNFFFILLALFLVQMIYMAKYANRLQDLKGWVIALFPVLSLILCMLFPVSINKDMVWDLRWIPFILGCLYGGYKLGFSLLFLVLTIRYLQGGVGFYIVLLNFGFITILSTLLSNYYLKVNIKKKVAISISLTILCLFNSYFLTTSLFRIPLDPHFWLKFIIIHLIGMVISTLLWEVIRTNFQVLQKLIKAEKIQMVGHLAASISHEVRNPLTVSRGFIQLLSEDISAQSRKEYAEIALMELDRATEVINDYLTFAKPTLEKEEKINIHDEIQHAVNVITPLATMNGVQINLSLLEQEQYFTKGEKKKFQQCLINILKNGIESMEDNGHLRIYQSFTNNMIKIDIQDEGKGMTQEQINRLGEPYFTTKEKGTGLGMMVSYSIIKGMNGTIKVTSEYGKGTCFTLKLPIFK